tara:strand:+ start:674 stop:1480 length:807 start_codon:yes stop_codon:yes gene_type:complete
MDAERLAAARTQFEDDGFYLHQEPLVPDDLIRRATEGMDAVRSGDYDTGEPPRGGWQPGDDPQKLCKIEMPQIANRAILELVSHPAIGELAAAISGAQMVQVWWVQLLGKPPADPEGAIPTNIGWHQDRQYWTQWKEGSELFTAWVALSDVTAESGPMRFVRGSNRWGFMDQSDFYAQDHEEQRETIAVPDGETWEEVAAIVPPGGASFHHNLTYHGSGPNVSTRMRRSFAIHLRTENSAAAEGVGNEGLTEALDEPAYCPVVYREAG